MSEPGECPCNSKPDLVTVSLALGAVAGEPELGPGDGQEVLSIKKFGGGIQIREVSTPF